MTQGETIPSLLTLICTAYTHPHHIPPRVEWTLRNRITCTLVWPEPRMAPAVALRGENELWVHGGYSVRFPYVVQLFAKDTSLPAWGSRGGCLLNG